MNLRKKISAIVCADCNDEDEQSVIEFGIGILFLKFLNLVTEIIIGCLFSMLTETIIFLIAFTFLRSYAGGFHASSLGKCYVFSSATMVVALLIIKYIDSSAINCIFISFGAIMCLIFSPIESENKPLDIIEKSIYRKRTILICSLILIILILAFCLQIEMLFKTLSVVLLVEGIMLALGKIR